MAPSNAISADHLTGGEGIEAEFGVVGAAGLLSDLRQPDPPPLGR